MKRLIALLLSAVFVLAMAGCGETEQETSGVITAVNELGNEYKNIDDMPDWTGDKLDLVVWFGYGSNETYVGKKAKDDKFRDEIERVTGVRLSEKESFDNGGQTGDTKIAKMVSTSSWPHIGIGVETSIAETLIEADQIYDLTDLIPKYMPNYWKILNSSEEIKGQWDRSLINGKAYALKRFSTNAFRYYDPEYTSEKYASLIQPVDSRAWIYVRDDILKQLYPEAKTLAEIQQIYMENGKFEATDLTDVTIKSKEDFRNLLEKIEALNITENGRKVWPFYTHSGEDNWDLLSCLAIPLAGAGAIDSQVSCFSYYDGETDEMKNTMKEPWFKDIMKFFNQLLIDGLASKEALIDSKANFEQKKVNGEYAVIYGNVVPPTSAQLKDAGKDFSYRPVMIDVPCDYNKFIRWNSQKSAFASYNMYLFKSDLNEKQLEHVMRFMDFFYSEAGMKLANWGPAKAGLYTEDENGNLRYADKAFETAQLHNGDKQIMIDYGILSFPRIDYFLAPDGINKYQPELMYANYEEERQVSGYKKLWKYSYFEPLPDFPAADFTWAIWSFPKYVQGADRFWDARQSIEDSMKTVFTATNDEEFEKYYTKMLKTAETNGFTDETLAEMTKSVKDLNGEIYDSIANWTAN